MDAAVVGFLSAGAVELRANPLGLPIGCQTYTVRKMIARDFPGTIKQLSDDGFQSIELCSPWGYADSRFGGLAKYKPAELRKIFSDMGVTCESSHFDIKELRENLAARIEWAKDVGLTQKMVTSLDGPRNPAMDDVNRAADEYNKTGEQSPPSGIHHRPPNHNLDLSPLHVTPTYH